MTAQVAQPISEQEADKRLKDLLHHFEGAKGRWHRLQRFGASDEVLKAAIAFEIGIFSGSSGPGKIGICGKGGKSSRVWIGCSMRSRPTLSGKRLISRVRSLMQIPYPTRLESHAGFCAGQAVWVLGRPDELPGQRLIQTWVNGVVEDFEGDRLRVSVAQRRQRRSRQRPMARYDALLKPEEVFAELPDWSGFLPFVEHIQIIERSLLRNLNQAMQEAHSDEQFVMLEDQELALIDAVSRWARSKGWRLVGKNGHWRCCPLRGQSRQFTPMLQPEDEAISDPLDFRQVYVKREGRFIPPPKPVQLSLFEGF
ncbi:hypothetical protein [Halomicronema sp. CCY15110]|uniref:hypothetical protein n=1 Tax=Halomicronema sp. CCY15110 TaxID=2767773 RepID=UPI001951C913|nr:hypothetical protein [Halomicronema sp. CCY15110]